MYVQLQLTGIVVLILPLYFVRYIYQVNLQLEQVNRDLLELMVKAIEAPETALEPLTFADRLVKVAMPFVAA